MDTKRVDVNGNNICLDDIVVVGSYDGNSVGYYDVGIVSYTALDCSFYIKCKYVNLDFTPFTHIKIIDRMCNHRNKNEQEVLEFVQIWSFVKCSFPVIRWMRKVVPSPSSLDTSIFP